MALAKKEEGNKFYTSKEYRKAVDLYTNAIGKCNLSDITFSTKLQNSAIFSHHFYLIFFQVFTVFRNVSILFFQLSE